MRDVKSARVPNDEGLSICLTANRNISIPEFLRDSSGNKSNQQRSLNENVPVKSIDSTFYRNARVGSKVLHEYREQLRRKLENSMLNVANQADSYVDDVDSREDQLSRDRVHLNLLKNARIGQGDTGLEKTLDAREKPLSEKRILDESLAIPPSLKGSKVADSTAIVCPELPVHKLRKAFLAALEEHQVLIVIGETGSGKTTQLPKYMHLEGYSENGIIGCTQPRRAAVVSIAKRVSEEMGCEIGTLVGYSMRFEDITSSATRIRYMTDGVLSKECTESAGKYLAKYSSIILDEVHERSLDTDLLLGFMQEVLLLRKDFRLIITSATIQSNQFLSFFPGAHVFHIPGRSYKVDHIYSTLPVEDYVDQAVSLAIDVHKTKDIDGDILIFMTGREDVLCTVELIRSRLEKFLPELGKKLLLLPVYALLSSTEQAQIFVPSPPGKRKCIVATNIAETSLTIDGIKYVIDSGYVKMKVFRPSLGISVLDVFPISQAQSNQRAGRAGRTSEGTCYRLYTRDQFEDEMLEATVPEIQRTSLSRVVLQIKSLGISDVRDFKFLTPPVQQSLLHACKELWMIGALDDENRLTRLGSMLLAFPTELLLSSFLICSGELGCSEEAIGIVALLSVEHRKILDFSKKQGYMGNAFEKYYICGSDHLTLLNVYENYQRNPLSEEWTRENRASQRVFRQAEKIRVQLRDIFIKRRIPLVSCGGNYEKVKKALGHSHFVNSARISGISNYVPLLQGRYPVGTQMGSSIRMSQSADYVIYHEILGTGSDKEYLSIVTEVDPAWVVEKRPELFHVFDAANEEIKLNLKSTEIIDNCNIQENEAVKSQLHPYGKPKIMQSSTSIPVIQMKKKKIMKISYSGRG